MINNDNENSGAAGDYIIKAVAGGGSIRVYGANTTNCTETARQIHNSSPTATAILGRLMAATLMIGAMMKGNETVTCRINGDGPLEGAVAFANSNGEVKGYPLNPYDDVPVAENGKMDVAGAIGEGYLTVSKDLGLKEPYAGRIPLVSGEIAEDFAQYYMVSEQTPSAVALGVLVDTDCSVKCAGGFIIQLLPGAPDEAADILTARLSQMRPLTTLLDSGKPIEAILDELFDGMGFSIAEKLPARFKCGCSKDKLYSVVAALGAEELKDILSKEKKAEIHCHFCNSDYVFTEDELKDVILWANISQ